MNPVYLADISGSLKAIAVALTLLGLVATVIRTGYVTIETDDLPYKDSWWIRFVIAFAVGLVLAVFIPSTSLAYYLLTGTIVK